jgi:predicted ArsR family transcriptional regulator
MPRDQEETEMAEQLIEDAAPVAPKPAPPKRIPPSKTEALRKLLSRRNGATAAQIQKQLGWQPHTIRAAISRLRSSGLSIDLDRSGNVARYRVVSGRDR